MSDSYAVFGHPVAHSLSPALHAAFAKQTGEAMHYIKQDIPPDAFNTHVTDFFSQGGCGLNITLPFKGDACALADVTSHRAQLAQAVNTLWQDGQGRLHGDNTDGIGLVRDLTVNQGTRITGQSVLLIGAGGAARGILAPLMAENPARLHIANRTAKRAHTLAAGFDDTVTGGGVDTWPKGPFDLIINASSGGHANTVNAPPAQHLAANAACYDLSYGPPAKAFLDWARQHGVRTLCDGWGMLVEQAAEAFLLWRGVRPNTKSIIAARDTLTS